jgi:hypothetical protein
MNEPQHFRSARLTTCGGMFGFELGISLVGGVEIQAERR